MAAVPSPTDWWKLAACRRADPDLFFPRSERNQAQANIARAIRVCMSCRVCARCLDYALSTGQQYGIWGGTTEDERKCTRHGA